MRPLTFINLYPDWCTDYRNAVRRLQSVVNSAAWLIGNGNGNGHSEKSHSEAPRYVGATCHSGPNFSRISYRYDERRPSNIVELCNYCWRMATKTHLLI